MRALSLVCAGLMVPVVAIFAQADSRPKFSVTGSVVNAIDGQPVRGALVELGGTERKSAMTGADGHFEIDGVAAGYADLWARHPGYNQQNQRQQRVKVGGDTDAITLKLTPLSKISGRVLDREGEPIEGVNVQCIGQQIVNGRKQWQMRSGVNTDDVGAFLIEGLNAGSYLLSTQVKALYFTNPKAEAARYVYPPTYYPDSPTRELAQAIEVGAGQDVKADMTLKSIRGSRVRVVTVPPESNSIAFITPADQSFGFNLQARSDKSGAFIFAAVSPGSWKIVVQGGLIRNGGQPNDQLTYGELPVDVGASDIDNLKLTLGKPAEIPVTVSGSQNQNISIQLLSKEGAAVFGSNNEPNGELKIRNVTPGTYRVLPFTGDNSICVTSVVSGSQNLMREELVVAQGTQPAPIHVVVGTSCPAITINTNASGMIVIASDNPVFEPRVLFSGNGHIQATLPDGDYRVYAFDDVTDLEYANPDALRPYKSESVHLETGQKATVQVEVNERQTK